MARSPTAVARGRLSADTIAQLKTLFGTARNVHARLNMGHHVILPYVQQALSGYPVPGLAAQIIEARWRQWRATFLIAPSGSDAAVRDMALGDFYHDAFARWPETGLLVQPTPERFTLLDDARTNLSTIFPSRCAKCPPNGVCNGACLDKPEVEE